MSRDEYNYKRRAMKAAEGLFYPQSVLHKIKNATNERQIERIMTNARKGIF